MRHTHEVPQLQDIQAQLEEARAHISRHREKYMFGAGLAVGIIGMRLLGRPPVVVVNHIFQGAPRG